MIVQVPVIAHFVENCFFYIDDATKHGFIIDPGAQAEKLLGMIREKGWIIEKILLTHGHFDHIGAVNEIRSALQIPVLAYKSENDYLRDPEWNLSPSFGLSISIENAETIVDDQIIRLDSDPAFSLKVIYTPGHTTDSVIYYSERDRAAFVGDTIFKDSIGNYQLPGGNFSAIQKSIMERVFTLPDDTVLYSGHTEQTTVGTEKRRYL
ncbi:MAG: MBL fold metallo-hydrolase [Verrucomicrobia bacterium]|nr:MBL fold metallo-hydrolase [Verrucomicrobiota bacterium]